MTSRRQFLQIGIAASALPLAPAALRAAELDGARRTAALPLYKVVYDSRFAASLTFARRATAHGASLQPIEGDMTWFWYHDLYHRWRSAPAAIAGLTAHGALFCLERLAWDSGLRVVFRAEHSASPTGVEHRLSGPQSMLEAARQAVAQPQWSAGLADVVLQCPNGRLEIASARTDRPGQTAAEDGEPLYSWVIAPAAHA
jgi:hypothetical protein